MIRLKGAETGRQAIGDLILATVSRGRSFGDRNRLFAARTMTEAFGKRERSTT